jgi:hypothetical protein
VAGVVLLLAGLGAACAFVLPAVASEEESAGRSSSL